MVEEIQCLMFVVRWVTVLVVGGDFGCWLQRLVMAEGGGTTSWWLRLSKRITKMISKYEKWGYWRPFAGLWWVSCGGWSLSLVWFLVGNLVVADVVSDANSWWLKDGGGWDPSWVVSFFLINYLPWVINYVV